MYTCLVRGVHIGLQKNVLAFIEDIAKLYHPKTRSFAHASVLERERESEREGEKEKREERDAYIYIYIYERKRDKKSERGNLAPGGTMASSKFDSGVRSLGRLTGFTQCDLVVCGACRFEASAFL